MPPLHLHLFATDRVTADRIERALQASEPGCTTRIVDNSDDLIRGFTPAPGTGMIVGQPAISPALRHELNNHLGVIRMLADILAEAPGISPLHAAKAREIGTAAEAAAQSIRADNAGSVAP